MEIVTNVRTPGADGEPLTVIMKHEIRPGKSPREELEFWKSVCEFGQTRGRILDYEVAFWEEDASNE